MRDHATKVEDICVSDSNDKENLEWQMKETIGRKTGVSASTE